jgi:hypothetical protein
VDRAPGRCHSNELVTAAPREVAFRDDLTVTIWRVIDLDRRRLDRADDAWVAPGRAAVAAPQAHDRESL